MRRYGFHGLSYEYIASRLSEVAPEVAAGRVIVAHLGSGASMCALSGGSSVESTMGFTALDGLPMGTRPGQIDPGVILYLIEQKKMSAAAVQNFLYRDCGLKGLSGISNDVRELQSSSDSRATFALDYFCYRVGLDAGMLAAALGGIDAFVFTAGIGENSAGIRARIAARLGCLGAVLDPKANAAHASRISAPHSRVALYVIPTDEELMIARHILATSVRAESHSTVHNTVVQRNCARPPVARKGLLWLEVNPGAAREAPMRRRCVGFRCSIETSALSVSSRLPISVVPNRSRLMRR